MVGDQSHSHIENRPEYAGLNVNQGIEPLPSVSESSVKRFLRNKKKRHLSVEQYVDGILNGDISVLSQAVTLVESSKPEHQEIAQEIIVKCLPFAGNSVRIGITGVPGVGKSTFIEAMGKYITAHGKKLAVLAIDPSSERTKGSILGDKTRMEDLSVDANAYIRPSPSAGSLGGVARKTRETIVLCEAAGFNHIFIETVGVGQSETAVHSMVDFFLLLMLAGAGDELQGIKRGIMEMADAITINKADGNNIEKAGLARVQYMNALHLFPTPDSGWKPKVLTCSAYLKTGISEIWDTVDEYLCHVRANNYFQHRRNEQSKFWMYETINEHLRNDFYQNEQIRASMLEAETKVLKEEISSFVAAKKLLDQYDQIRRNDKPYKK
jgi:LAO/AO transport system kinase